ncbi:unnamed protein product [Chironomus riparius]|uniref:Uncharacterized protein n=1 Tax=Chironomus riparius TaxID=315576 RepID=A0A9N9RQ34_9DIPT|nr:unnamed protein product [Chironomus riparius]
MKFIIILYIFAIILVCNAGILQRNTRSEDVESEVNNATEHNQVNDAETTTRKAGEQAIIDVKCPPGRIYVAKTCRKAEKVKSFF